ncbi:MAG: peptide chain release factor N(5)-glutamine methyltransferase [Clostridia bacterium]|nr:peptide chain release factor N(5)-glutamine methyltransferase [Clostridia bacterium]
MKNAEKTTKPAKFSKIGGQALIEGIMMRGETSMAIAVRDPQGDILVETERLKEKRWYNRWVIFRGVAAFISSLVTGMRTLMKSASVVGDEDEQLSKGAMGLAVFLGILLAVALFVAIPEGISYLIHRYLIHSVLLKSIISGILKIGIFILYLYLVTKMEDIKRTFMYHGAEHKTINCYESGKDLTVDNVRACSTRHTRCGTTFLFLVLVVSILVYAVVNFLLDRFVNISSTFGEMSVYFVIKLAILPLIAGISYEFLRLFALMPDNIFAKILRAPGLALQRLTTYEPTDDMMEVAIRAFDTVLKMDDDQSIKPHTFGEVDISEAYAVIRAIDKNEAVWLLSEVTGVEISDLYSLKSISLEKFKKLKGMVQRRQSGEPFDYVLGNSVFYGIKLKVSPAVLIPRNETELLVETALSYISGRTLKVADVCTGSGCIAAALAANSSCEITAIDLSDEALEIAQENLKDTGVTLVKSDLLAYVDEQYNLIVSNPPYIATDVIPTLDAEVTCQPYMALNGGEDGLDIIRRLAAEAHSKLTYAGAIMMEIGYDQGDAVRKIFTMVGFRNVRIIKDYGGNDRIVFAEK